ncbi:MAG: outer membrane protein transport protein [Muribaculaceae bacterium]|nr:outer membrane protein transport protein [Muribaculaceae bacterium]
MKKIAIALIFGACGATVAAQSALDYRTLSDSQLRGTARYMSMAGAFGALGGDISTLTQNPAGIGVYRSSEITATLDIDPRRITLDNTGSEAYRHKQTNVACNNFGYIGSVRTGSEVMPFFQWGASYNRLNTFNRYYRGYFPVINTSWTNYVASSSGAFTPGMLKGTDNYDPFYDSDADWLSALAFNTRLINFTGDGYTGLFQPASSGNAEVSVEERGYIDEYSINFGGNFSDMIYWGIGFGIRDLSFTRTANYNEQISDANVRYGEGDDAYMANGAAEWGIDTYQSVSGAGFNVKFGLIFKPVNEFRLGLAVHTPTWYSLQLNQSANITYGLGMPPTADYDYYTYDNIPGGSEADNPYAETGTGYWTRNFKTPWRLMASAATVLGGRFILSADYVYEAYPQMGDYGVDASVDIAQDVKTYYSGSNEFRLGAEWRVTPAFSLRAGYGYKTSGVTTETENGDSYIYTAGVNSMYTLDGTRQNITAGIGYRWSRVSIDLAYVHTSSTAQWHAFSPFPHQPNEAYALAGNAERGPQAKLTDTSNRIALTLGFRF